MGERPNAGIEKPGSIWGDNPRLRNIVLALVAILIVGRIVTMALAVEEYWRPAARLLGYRVPPNPDPSLAYAQLKGNIGQFFGPDSYPDDARDRGEQGRVIVDLVIDPAGFVTDCRVAETSRSRSLDLATCRIALDSIRFDPARGNRGEPIASTYRLTVRWQLPL